jgi:hypothetical protein
VILQASDCYPQLDYYSGVLFNPLGVGDLHIHPNRGLHPLLLSLNPFVILQASDCYPQLDYYSGVLFNPLGVSDLHIHPNHGFHPGY